MMHTPMLQTNMSAELHYFFTKHLDMLRLNIPKLVEQIDLWNGRDDSQTYDENKQWTLISMCGYHVDFGKNLAVLVGLMAILGLTLVILAFVSIIH